MFGRRHAPRALAAGTGPDQERGAGDAARIPEDSASNEDLFALFHRTAHRMIRAHRHQGHAHHAQMHVLLRLREHGPLSQRELMEELGVRSASLSEVLAKLERAGCILRERDPEDRRGFIINATPQGLAALKEHESAWRGNTAAVFDPLSDAERGQLRELLRKILAGLGDEPARDQTRRHRRRTSWPADSAT